MPLVVIRGLHIVCAIACALGQRPPADRDPGGPASGTPAQCPQFLDLPLRPIRPTPPSRSSRPPRTARPAGSLSIGDTTVKDCRRTVSTSQPGDPKPSWHPVAEVPELTA